MLSQHDQMSDAVFMTYMLPDSACVYNRVTDALLDLFVQVLTCTCLARLIGKSCDLFVVDAYTSCSWVALVRFNYFRLVRHLTNESGDTISVVQSQF